MMIYFEILAWTLGLLNTAAVVSYFAARGKWRSFIFNAVVPEERPAWIVPTIAVVLIWVIFTWIQVAAVPRAITYVLAFYITLALPKLLFFHLQYPHMRTLVKTLLGSGNLALNIVMVCGLIIGLGFIAIGIYL